MSTLGLNPALEPRNKLPQCTEYLRRYAKRYYGLKQHEVEMQPFLSQCQRDRGHPDKHEDADGVQW